MNRITWHGCYDDSWKGLIVDDAFAHPAKMARGLVARIFEHLLDMGAIGPGSTIVDPFGGIGTTAIAGASRGCRVICCELEPKFVELAKRNFELHRRTWESCGDPLPVMVQGDSRRLVEALGPVLADVCVASQPYAEHGLGNRHTNGCHWGAEDPAKSKAREQLNKSTELSEYGQSPGQLGSMKAGEVEAVISSPPYSEGLGHGGTPTKGGGKNGDVVLDAMQNGYGTTTGNLGNLPPGSVADAVVSSPPYEGDVVKERGGEKEVARAASKGARPHQWGHNEGIWNGYGSTHGNLGNDHGQTFWSAARQIVEQCHAILKPSGIAVWVCKDFVRNKKRVPFSDDWRKLCEACGFELVQWIEASLVKETEHATLFDGVCRTRKERKSFFRRLAEKKGSPRIDHEDVLIMKPRR